MFGTKRRRIKILFLQTRSVINAGNCVSSLIVLVTILYELFISATSKSSAPCAFPERLFTRPQHIIYNSRRRRFRLLPINVGNSVVLIKHPGRACSTDGITVATNGRRTPTLQPRRAFR